MIHLEEKKETIKADYKEGASISYLARRYKCAYNTMVKKLKEWEVYKAREIK